MDLSRPVMGLLYLFTLRPEGDQSRKKHVAYIAGFNTFAVFNGDI
jgi:hypothetical protein